MKCSCPKCSASINVDDPVIPEKGNFSRCPDCNSRFWLHRESFLMRAYKKDWKAFCHHCGEEVGSASYCQSCYQPFPEYWVVQSSRPARRKSTYKADISLSLPGFSFKKTKTVEKIDAPDSAEPVEHYDIEPEEKTGMPRKPILVATLAVLIVVGLFFGGKSLFKGNEELEAYNKEYIKVLYGVTKGADLSIEKLTQMTSGQPLSEKDAMKLQRIKANVDKFWLKMQNPPEGFNGSLDDVEGIYRAYTALHMLAVTTSVVTPGFQGEVEKLTSRLDQSEQNFKNGLSDDLKERILKVTDKFENLRFVEG